MTQTLRALVLGSGFAGQCHTAALRSCGVEVVGMASRTAEVVERVARDLGIPHASADWRSSITSLKPDIIAVATPGGVHLEMCVAAAEAGCHIYCDKPLATTAAGAKQIWLAARDAGVKTAYAATSRYNPSVLHAKQLVAAGAIGAVSEVECVSHYDWARLMPFGWSHRLELGGGRLNNNFTHKLSVVLQVLGGAVLSAMGESRNDLKRAPVGPPVHDFRNIQTSALSEEMAARATWKEVDSDWAYTVLARIGAPGTDPAEGVSALFRHAGMRPGVVGDYIAFYGSEGTIHIDGAYGKGKLRLIDKARKTVVVDTPAEILGELPEIDNDAERNWTQLARDFVEDIRGNGYRGYLTLRDGWIFQEVIDIVRSGGGWSPVPQKE